MSSTHQKKVVLSGILLKKGKDGGKDTEETLIELSPEADLCIVGRTELSHHFVIIQILSEIKKK